MKVDENMHFLDKPLIAKIFFNILSISKIKGYKHPYIFEKSKFKINKLIKKNLSDKSHALVFVIHDAKNWILEGICREIATYFPDDYFFAYSLVERPQAFIPLIETMMCNVVPVASRTGFAPDVINHGENGFIFDIDSSCEVVCELIDQAFTIQADISKSVENLSWKNF